MKQERIFSLNCYFISLLFSTLLSISCFRKFQTNSICHIIFPSKLKYVHYCLWLFCVFGLFVIQFAYRIFHGFFSFDYLNPEAFCYLIRSPLKKFNFPYDNANKMLARLKRKERRCQCNEISN
jgi:hypothetical protein